MNMTFKILLFLPVFFAFQASAADAADSGGNDDLKSLSDLKSLKGVKRKKKRKLSVGVVDPKKKRSVISEPVKKKATQEPAPEQAVEGDLEEPKERTISQSVLFSEEEIVRLNTVYDAYIQNLKNNSGRKSSRNSKDKDVLQDIVDKLRPAERVKKIVPKKVYVRAPAYLYLNSILYRSKADSKIWINGDKIESEEINDGLSIASITPDKVKFNWKVIDGQIPLDEWKEKSKDAAKQSESRIVVVPSKRMVQFSLGVNQTFNVRDMVITEGKDIVALQGADNDTFYDPRFPDTKFTPEGRKAFEAQKAREALGDKGRKR